MVRRKSVTDIQQNYLAAVLSGDLSTALGLVKESHGAGMGVASIYIDVLTPAQTKIGQMWHDGLINIAEEHLATSITLDVMKTLGSSIPAANNIGYKAVVTPVESDGHVVGAQMFSDLLRSDGWEVDFLAYPTPVDDLVSFVEAREHQLIAISLTQLEFLPKAQKTSLEIHRMNPSIKVLLGGFALSSTHNEVELEDFDGVAGNAIEGLQEARRLVGLPSAKLTLEEHLLEMGANIKRIRSEHRLTQQELADQSDMDRTYISMVEHGKQNLTMGALLRISEALDVPLSEILGNESYK